MIHETHFSSNSLVGCHTQGLLEAKCFLAYNDRCFQFSFSPQVPLNDQGFFVCYIFAVAMFQSIVETHQVNKSLPWTNMSRKNLRISLTEK